MILELVTMAVGSVVVGFLVVGVGCGIAFFILDRVFR